jgi:uncharacterized membrane protein YhaH (DUF805 family)
MNVADLSYPVLVICEEYASVWISFSPVNLGLCSADNPQPPKGWKLIDSDGRLFEFGPVTRLRLGDGLGIKVRQWLIHYRYADFDLVQVGRIDWSDVQSLVVRLQQTMAELDDGNPDFEGMEPDQTPMGHFEKVRTGVQASQKIADLEGLLEEVSDPIYVGSQGRANRREYWILLGMNGAWLSLGAMTAGTLYLLGVMARHAFGDHFMAGLLLWLFGTFCIVSLFVGVRALGKTLVRRLKDLNAIGGWILLGLLVSGVTWAVVAQTTSSICTGLWAGLGVLIAGLILLGALPGSRGDNEYGAKSVF